MGIMYDEQFFGTNLIHRDEILNCFLECAKRLVVSEVADMLADECLSVQNQGDGVLQIGADRQDWTCARNRRERSRRVASCTAKDDWAEHSAAGYRIVDAACDWTLSDQE